MDNPEKPATHACQTRETRKIKQKHKNTTKYVLDTYAQTNTDKVNKTLALLQTTGGKDVPDK